MVEKKSTQFLVHHSRDTAEKQWAETKRLTLQGLTKLFKENKSGLSPAEWVRCWKGNWILDVFIKKFEAP